MKNEDAKPYIYAAARAAENAEKYNESKNESAAIQALEQAAIEIQSALEELLKDVEP